jgi:uncharacterized protein (DUF1330 family)
MLSTRQYLFCENFMTAYLIANVVVTNPEKYEDYKRLSTRAMSSSNAKVLARGGAAEALEGKAPGRTVVLEFPSMTAARAFYDSWQYRRARNARERASITTMYIVEGI